MTTNQRRILMVGFPSLIFFLGYGLLLIIDKHGIGTWKHGCNPSSFDESWFGSVVFLGLMIYVAYRVAGMPVTNDPKRDEATFADFLADPETRRRVGKQAGIIAGALLLFVCFFVVVLDLAIPNSLVTAIVGIVFGFVAKDVFRRFTLLAKLRIWQTVATGLLVAAVFAGLSTWIGDTISSIDQRKREAEYRKGLEAWVSADSLEAIKRLKFLEATLWSSRSRYGEDDYIKINSLRINLKNDSNKTISDLHFKINYKSEDGTWIRTGSGTGYRVYIEPGETKRLDVDIEGLDNVPRKFEWTYEITGVIVKDPNLKANSQ